MLGRKEAAAVYNNSIIMVSVVGSPFFHVATVALLQFSKLYYTKLNNTKRGQSSIGSSEQFFCLHDSNVPYK